MVHVGKVTFFLCVSLAQFIVSCSFRHALLAFFLVYQLNIKIMLSSGVKSDYVSLKVVQVRGLLTVSFGQFRSKWVKNKLFFVLYFAGHNE